MEKNIVKKKILVLGSSGLIGHTIHNFLGLNKNFDIFDISKSKLDESTIELDVKNFDSLEILIRKIKPDFIINCIGILNKSLIKIPDKDFLRLNGLLPRHISNLSKTLRFRLINISTDCVFSGKSGPYNENSIPDAIDIYGESKAVGENISKNNLVIRTSVVGPDLDGNSGELFDWFISQHEDIKGYKNVIWSGVTTFELARAVEFSIENDISGIKNLAMPCPISKHDLLKKLSSKTKRNIRIYGVNKPCSNKVLICNSNWYKLKFDNYDDLLDEMITEIKTKSIYDHYGL